MTKFLLLSAVAVLLVLCGDFNGSVNAEECTLMNWCPDTKCCVRMLGGYWGLCSEGRLGQLCGGWDNCGCQPPAVCNGARCVEELEEPETTARVDE